MTSLEMTAHKIALAAALRRHYRRELFDLLHPFDWTPFLIVAAVFWAALG